ncbi:NAD(+) synthase [Asaia bogorensis]|uniref:Glutamine-dependent NAD(+) synthetase n=1 Tax=Asaia bogorensis NBRC 16594 TaxID=1231624 RepID=A0AAN4R1D6_9PROT|nr:NAD(+) synthase [Asaia bogorensis]BAT18764.1 NAD+ synthetase [Asaia bogorensis NBRC 16594]GBQ75787.1 NAD synthetase [Asaia bogorensis NBRC 16594]GEL53118.1 NAD(+) synthase [Asaia bogorensis NBRC 16594]
MSTFRSLYRHGFARVAACTVPVRLADPQHNVERIVALASHCAKEGAVLAVFPEMCLSGYAIDDLRQQDALLDGVVNALKLLADRSRDWSSVVIVGAPLVQRGRLFNCAVVLHRGKVLGVVPKTYLPNYREFYDSRHFISGAGIIQETIRLGEQTVPFGTDLLFEADDLPDFTLGIEICEDLWVPSPPSTAMAMAGATVIGNPSASTITIGKSEDRHLLCRAQSQRALCAYVYAAAGAGESTTDVAWDGQVSIYEAGRLLGESARFPKTAQVTFADIDLDLLRQERMRMGSFHDCARAQEQRSWRRIAVTLAPPQRDLGFQRDVPRFPFVPENEARLDQDCYEAWTIQVRALTQRLETSGVERAVIGVSGGLDSTLALLVAARAADEMGWDRNRIHAYTMPGFATGSMSLSLAHELMKALGVEAHELDIRPTAMQMLETIEHPFAAGEAVHDVTFENVQAGLRTDFLFRLANQCNGIVIGTGDLSELALGWCTYGVGDQMSHYNVNAGMPKTLIQHLIRWLAQQQNLGPGIAPVLERIVSAEITPELVPADDKGVQKTEEKIGPYPLQDFNLYYTLRYGFRPDKILFLALQAWEDKDRGIWPAHYPQDRRVAYDAPEIKRWLTLFIKRFFGFSQFKRSAMPNGPKLSSGGSLSPRGEWRAPSDGTAAAWLAELETLEF